MLLVASILDDVNFNSVYFATNPVGDDGFRRRPPPGFRREDDDFRMHTPPDSPRGAEDRTVNRPLETIQPAMEPSMSVTSLLPISPGRGPQGGQDHWGHSVISTPTAVESQSPNQL